ncbi:Sensory box histidine kinase [Flavobacteriaceae bacterium 3519-10]|nr:Sensory box histidine kinase [Flavobacteriaceae bacterium 3519-10]
MELFVWNMAISYQLLFVILSGTVFYYLREPCFKHYALYNFFLAVYVITRNDAYYALLESSAARFLGAGNAHIFIYIVFFYVQILFYTFYSHFALYFLDLDAHVKKYFNRVILALKILGVSMIATGIISYITKDIGLPMTVFTYVYLPSLLIIFLATLLYAVRFSGQHRKFFLIGICCFVTLGLVAFIGSRVDALDVENPINFFYIGIILETLFFNLALAHKLKLLNDEKNRVRREMTRSKHRLQLSKLHGLLEGEERERKRLAEELHDGIAGDLAAIKFNLHALKTNHRSSGDEELIGELTQIIDRSCVQIREISHNLSPSTVTNFGLMTALENFCLQNQTIHGISIGVNFSGEPATLSKSVETHLYRIIQELITNTVKHAGAKHAAIHIWHHAPYFTVTVTDDGKGFSQNGNTPGIGLSNINSRIRFLNAGIKKETTAIGSKFVIEIDLRKLPGT